MAVAKRTIGPRTTRKPPKSEDAREDKFNLAFGQKLKLWRDANSRSQKWLAERLGATENQYGRWERGERSFPLYLLIVLRKITDRSIADWLQGIDVPLNITFVELKE